MKARSWLASAAAALILTALAPAQQVWIVDAGGAGDFLQPQEAVDAAADGDTVLLYPLAAVNATYDPFEIQGKGLHVATVEGAIARVRHVVVRELPAGSVVDLTRLRIGWNPTPGLPGVRVLDCHGAVSLTRCEVQTALGQPALLVEATDSLTLVDCQLTGSWSPGIDALASSIAIYRGSVIGGQGPDLDFGQGGQAGDGSHGLWLRASTAVLHEVQVRGGRGGDACNSAGSPGDGGHGAVLELGSTVHALATQPQGGGKGIGFCVFLCSSCSEGMEGMEIVLDSSSSWIVWDSPVRRLEASKSLLEEGGKLTLRFRGAPSDEVYLARSDHAGFRLLPSLFGVAHLLGGSGHPGAFLGVLPESGVLEVEVPVHQLPAGAVLERRRIQLVVVNADSETALGNPALVEVLHPSLVSPCAAPIHVRADAAPGGDGQSWDTAVADLQDGLALALEKRALCTLQPGVEVWVARGTYEPAPPGGPRTAFFGVDSRIHLLGGFAGTETSADERDPSAHPTILSGDLLGDDTPDFGNRDDNTYRVVRTQVSSQQPPALVDGFTIRGGHADGTVTLSRNGGGLHVAGAVTVRRCRIEDNYALETGGGMYLQDAGAPRWIVDCQLVGNRAGIAGGGAYAGRRGSFLNCLFDGNTVEATNGSGGGLWAQTGFATAVGSVTNCIFTGNRAARGAAVRTNLPYDATLDNHYPISTSTFFENEATLAEGAALWLATGRARLTNSILWGNTSNGLSDQAGQFFESAPAVLVAHHSAVQGLVADLGPGNIAADPLLDAQLDLSPGSPCIDAGDNTLVPADEFDLDGDLDVTEPLPLDHLGRPRFVDDPAAPNTGVGDPPLVDMGALERQVR